LSLRIMSHLKGLPKFDRRNFTLSSWRKEVKDLSQRNKMKFNVGGIQAETREGLVTEILKFMETEEGKKKMALWVGWGGTFTLGIGSWLYHLYCQELVVHEYCLEKDKDRLNIKSIYSSEFESDPEMSKLSAMCRVRSGLALEQFDRLTLFESELLDPVTNGSLSTSSGAIIGMPGYMVRGEDKDLDLSKLVIKTNYNRWFKGFKIPEDISQEDTQELKDSLSFTKEEKNFIMSFCMAKANSWAAVVNTVAIPLTYFFAYNFGHALNKKLQLFSRPRIFRIGLVGWISCTFLALYISWYNFGNLEFDSYIYEDICKTIEQIDSGLSYYNKLLRRNVILRRVIGKEMDYYIQESGEYVPMIYQLPDACDISAKIKLLNFIKKAKEEELKEKLD